MELYFSGGSGEEIENFMWENNCCRLFSQFRERSAIKRYIEKGGKNIFLDSGAFSAYNSGAIVDIDALCEYANSITENCKFIACLDVIGDPEKSYENFIYMRTRLKEPHKLIPAFHINEPFDWMYKYLNYEDEFGKLDKLAIGGIAKVRSFSLRKQFLHRCEVILRDYPEFWIHLFGVTDLSLIDCYSFIHSVDSTNHIMKGIYGQVVIPPLYKAIYIGGSTKEKNTLNKNQSEHIKFICDKLGMNSSDLVEHNWARTVFSVESMLEWLEHYNNKQHTKKVHRKRLF